MTAAAPIVSVIGCAGGASIRGASHIARQKPNQDAMGYEQHRLWTFVAVADGHGSAPHYRSDRGSRFAIAAAMSVMREATDGGALREPEALASRMSGIAPKLVDDWQARVRADLARDPPGEGGDRYTPYGSTCVAAGIGPGMALLLQIGDGDIFVGSASGGIAAPVPADDTQGEQTYSLCLAEATEHVKVRLYSAPSPLGAPDFVLVATDGFAKSFDDAAAVEDVVGKCRQATQQRGLAPIVAELEPWLAQCSQLGSGDDTSVAIFAVDRATTAMPGGATIEPNAAAPAPAHSTGLLPMFAALLIGGLLGALAMAWAARDALALLPVAEHRDTPTRVVPADPHPPDPLRRPVTEPR